MGRTPGSARRRRWRYLIGGMLVAALAVTVSSAVSMRFGLGQREIEIPDPPRPWPPPPTVGILARFDDPACLRTLAGGLDELYLEPLHEHLVLDRPVDLLALPGGRHLLVAEQPGRVLVVPVEDGASSARVLLDLRDRVSFLGGEDGLLGLALHPDRDARPRLFVSYTAGADPVRLTIEAFELTSSGEVEADAATGRRILEVDKASAIHNGGRLLFGPDGYLYVGVGDGTTPETAQDRSTLLGSILRIDVDAPGATRAYDIPPDNPFAAARDRSRPEIWAYGLRNPWGCDFVPGTGQLVCADVGHATIEELDLVEAGQNHGWPLFEGDHCIAPPCSDARAVRAPIAQYSHGDGCAVMGGFVYRGRDLPPPLRGAFLHADNCTGELYAAWLRRGARAEVARIAVGPPGPSGIRPGPGGEALWLDHLGGRLLALRGGEPTTDEPSPFEWPESLEETGCLSPMGRTAPRASLVPYGLRTPAHHDPLEIRRHLSVPVDEALRPTDGGRYHFPSGTIAMQTFSMPTGVDAPDRVGPAAGAPVETRILRKDGAGWSAASYLWEPDGSGARLVTEARSVRRIGGSDGRRWEVEHAVPAPVDCLSCHSASAGTVLGITPSELDLEVVYPHGVRRNQLDEMRRVGMIAASPAHR